MMGDGGFPPIPPAVAPLELDPSWPPKTVIAGDSGVTAAVDTLLGAAKPLSIAACFDRILNALAKAGNNGDGGLLSEVADVQERVLARLQEQRDARKNDLERRRSDLYSACRLVRDHILALKTQQGQAATAFNGQAAKLNGVRNEATAIQSARPNRQDYPSASEIAIWQAAVNEVAVRLDEAQTAFDESRSALVQITGELAVETAKLDEYAEREKLLSAQIEGREWTEKNGLVHPAGEEF